MKFEELKSRWDWSPIRNCPGRFVWRGGNDKNISPAELLGAQTRLSEFRVERAKDPVIVARLGDGVGEGGLISYRKDDGSHVHTLNTAEGFARKLQQLGIELE